MRALVHGHTCDHQRLGSADHLVGLEEQRRGNSQPSSFAVLRWMTNSHVVGCSTGRSAGLVPFRILSTSVAARRSCAGMGGP
jgi:hypothetical protein